MDPTFYRSLRGAESGAAEAQHAHALAMLEARRWDAAMQAFEQAFARDAEGLLDRRACFDWFRTLRIEEISDFWLGELTRFFRRYDIDKSHYSAAGLQALAARPPFRAWLAGSASEADLDAVMADALLGSLLRESLVGHSTFEAALTRLRARLLQDEALRARVPLLFLCDLALQCFNNEYVFGESAQETMRLDALAAEVEVRLSLPDSGSERLQRSIAVLGMYRLLSEVPKLDRIIAPASAEMDRLLRRTVVTTQVERRLANGIRTVGRIEDPTSLRVRAQYEENPYPRWFTLDRWPPLSAASWAGAEVPGNVAAALPLEPRVLVAGCGTGGETLALATRVPAFNITAIDLSRASLAYAQRKANRIGAGNVEFLQVDILELDTLPETFDIVYSTGVLHHMSDAQTGVRLLARRLRPGGLMKIGLYSERARGVVRAARAQIAAEGIPATAAGIREFRQRVLQSAPDSPSRRLLRWRDFFTLSECRDLLLPAEEHDFRLPQIAAMLRAEGLEILGLSLRLPPGAAAAYAALYPGEEPGADLGRWDTVEEKHPDLFAGMFHVWCRKPPT